MKPAPSVPEPLRDEAITVGWLAEVTGQAEEVVRRRLRREFERPGISVAEAVANTGLTPYMWHEDLARFYETTDAFLFELVIWNRNRVKRRMRRWTARHLAKYTLLAPPQTSEPAGGKPNAGSQSLDVLCIGDGLGFDSVFLAQHGHRVTYFEVPGYANEFARRVFAYCHTHVRVLTAAGQIPTGQFDAVVCLDVLEHVPDPPALVGKMVDYLRPGGSLIVHAPFYMIHPSTPTHLKSARRYSGSLALFERAGLRLVDGTAFWNPIALRKPGGGTRPPARARLTKRLALRLIGVVLALGRVSALPFFWVATYRNRRGSWFDR